MAARTVPSVPSTVELPVPPVSRAPLNPRQIDALRPTGAPFDVFDGAGRGLALRVGPSGRKTWRFFYARGAKRIRLTLGEYPELGLKTARERAEELRQVVRDGGDPKADHRAERASWGDTVADLIDRYATHGPTKQRRFSEKLRILNIDVRPAWGDRRVQDLRRRDVLELVERKAATAPVLANRLLAHISTLLNYAIDKEIIEANPAARLKKPAEETSRERVLTGEELTALVMVLTKPDPAAFVKAKEVVPTATERAAFLALLYSGQRLTETCAMRWADVDLDAGWWTIPAAVSKNKDPHRVPLVGSLRQLVQARADAPRRDAVYVFAGRTCETSIARRAKKVAARLSRVLDFSFRAHDLRRSCASMLAAQGTPRFDIACLLNHRSVTRGSITSIYDRYSYDAEKVKALTKWGAYLDTLQNGAPGARVVPMPRRPRGHRRAG